MSTVTKRTIPLALTFLIGLILIFEWFIPTEPGDMIGSAIREWGVIIASFAVMVGAVGLYGRNIKNIQKKGTDWIFSAWMIFVVSLFIIVGVTLGHQDTNYRWIYTTIYQPLSATMYGAISFYIAASSYKILRLRSKEAAVLLIPAAILLLANTPLISSTWGGFSASGSWLMSTITQPAYRGIMIGTALGTLATGIRTLMGMETGWLGRTEEGE
jgi:hypothetical protein